MSPARRAARRRALTWTAAVGVPVLVGAAILVPVAASGATDLPDKTPAELLAFAADSDVTALSGTVEQSSDLGLPDLGALAGSTGDDGSAADVDDLLELVTGSHTAKVYLDGDSARVQVLDQLGERNVYVDGASDQAWFVDSETQTATQLSFPSDAKQHESAPSDTTLPTPEAMLDQALARLDETTDVTVGTDGRVAGRDVYELVLTPRSQDTLVGELRFAIDGETGAALSASVTARGASDPAFAVGFTQVDFSAPDASVFAFTPGDGFQVTQKDIAPPEGDHAKKPADAAAPTVYGEGWSTVAELPSRGSGALTDLDPSESALLDSLTTAVDGGRVLQTSLLSVMITDDGRVLVGAVPTDRLVEAAQTGS
ncbi:DUF2092 domain-containing protein [Microbacterium sp. 1P10UB]|uniref:LolA family protein n=1 Tax=unclassified Microbacterium TaxID=2609290 RepID=UPI0039A3A2AB